MPRTPTGDGDQPASVEFPGLVQVIARTLERIARRKDPVARALHHAQLMDALQEQREIIALARDEAIIQALNEGDPPPSHNQLAPMLGVSRQRVDQLAKLAKARTGKRTRR